MDAKAMLGETSDLRATNSLRQVLIHVNSAHDAHTAGDAPGASAHMREAAGYLQDAAKIHTGKLERGAHDSSAVMLGHEALGRGHQIHQEYLEDINKGNNNGR